MKFTYNFDIPPYLTQEEMANRPFHWYWDKSGTVPDEPVYTLDFEIKTRLMPDIQLIPNGKPRHWCKVDTV